MSIGTDLLPEFGQEMKNTRRVLERVPDGKFGWKPHEKSMTLGRLANHLANIPDWTNAAIGHDSLDIAPADGSQQQVPQAETRDGLLAAFDKNVAAAREALAKVTDDELHRDWSLLAGGKTLFTMKRLGVIRTWVLNHCIHHRAQLGVYLRLNDIPIPGVYGPSADERA